MPTKSKELRHPIKVVCHRTGLTAHTIRVWERRYGLVCCQRTNSNRRLYSDDEIERLRLLKSLTDCGHRISQLSKLDLESLFALQRKDCCASSDIESTAPPPPLLKRQHETPNQCVDRCLEALMLLDATTMTELLEQSLLRYGARTTFIHIIGPFVQHVGDAWRRGELRIIHEHLTTNVVRDFLALSSRCYPNQSDAPEIVIATPINQHHEVGALLATAASRDLGWRPTYLGPNLSAEEIAAAVEVRKARAVALSTVFPGDDPQVPNEITRLRQMLPTDTILVLGGRAAFGYHQTLRIPDVHLVTGLHDLENILGRVPSKGTLDG